MRTAYFQCASGISGDMCLGALLHAGVDFVQLKEQLSLLGLEGYHISRSKVLKNGIAGTKVDIALSGPQPHRHFGDIEQILNCSSLAPEIKERSRAIFLRLGEAEARVHGTTLEKVHFHETGAVDALIDIAGTVICLSLLQVDRIVSSPLPMGHGFVTCSHGTIPLPAPATQELLKGIPVYGVDIEGELVTPTGAGIIATLAHSFGPFPAMKVDALGFGAGTKNYPIPNLLTVSIGASEDPPLGEQVEVIETSIDDMNPEVFSHLWELVFSLGALEMFLTPVQMKKGRPGTLLTILCREAALDALTSMVLRETSSLGVRIRRERRLCCSRETVCAATKFGPVRVKIGSFRGSVNIAPEFEDCRKLALARQVPLKEIYREALAVLKESGLEGGRE